MSKLDFSQRMITQDVDLTQLPTPISEQDFRRLRSTTNGTLALTLPDMHGNGFKLLHYLLWLGLIRFKEDADTDAIFSELFQIHLRLWDNDTYDNSEAVQALLEAWAESIQNNFEATARMTNVQVRCIGDMFGDRGPNDILTKDILHSMKHTWQIPYDLFYGNHDHEIQCWLEDETLRPGTDLRQQESLTRAKKCVKQGILSREEFKESIHDVITPHWKLFDIDIIDDSHWLTFGHSIPLIPVLFYAAKDLGIPLSFTINTCSKAQLIRLANSVNQRFSELASKEQLTHTGQPADPETIIESVSLSYTLVTNEQHFSPDDSSIPADRPIAFITSTRNVIKEDYIAHQSCCERLGLEITTVSGHLGNKENVSIIESHLTTPYMDGAGADYCEHFKHDEPKLKKTPLANHINLDKQNPLGRITGQSKIQQGKAVVMGSMRPHTLELLSQEDQTLPLTLKNTSARIQGRKKDNEILYQKIMQLDKENAYMCGTYSDQITAKHGTLPVTLTRKLIRGTRITWISCLGLSLVISMACLGCNFSTLLNITSHLTTINLAFGVGIGLLLTAFVACCLYSTITNKNLKNRLKPLEHANQSKDKKLKENAQLWDKHLFAIKQNRRTIASLKNRSSI